MKRLLLLFLALVVPLVAGATTHDVLVVAEKSTSAAYTSLGRDPELTGNSQLLAVERALRGWGTDFVVMPPSALTTAMCGSGLVYLNKTPGGYAFVAEGPVDTFRAVIHANFNGSAASQFTGYRPDSMTRTDKLPTVPQLYLLDQNNSGGDFNFNNSASDSTWITGEVCPEHHFGGSHMAPGRLDQFTSITSSTVGGIIKSGSPNGGVRVLLAAHANSQTLPQPDYVASTVTDSATVWEKLNLHKAGSARIVFAAVGASSSADSAGRIAYYRTDIEWPALLFAIAHLDSLTGGRIIRKPRQFGFVITGGGTTSDRRHPGGLFQASDRSDTTIHRGSMDSVATTGAKVVVAAAPESLTAAEAMRWKRAGSVRFTPWVRFGLDTLALPASGTASASNILDVWGRYRNRWVYGSASDTGAIVPMYLQARSTLAATVGANYISRAIVAPDDDWSPYQMRRNQNAALIDSLAWAAAYMGCPVIISNTWGRDFDPSYLTNPKGWIGFNNRRYTIQASSLKGTVVSFVGHSQFTIMGSRVHSATDAISFLASASSDTSLTASFFYAQMPTYSMYAFWNSFYGPYDAVSWNDGAGLWSQTTAAPAWSSTAFDNVPGTHQPAEIMVLPAQSFGGQSATTPNRWGFWAIKHVMGAARLINYAAGRTVMQNAWPEDIVP